jgi:hypothetical protein
MPKESDPDRIVAATAEPGPGGSIVAVTAYYGPGQLLTVLKILEDAHFNLRTAGGRRIETGGEFAFWVDEPVVSDGRQIDDDHGQTHAAIKVLCAAGYEAWPVEVHSRNLDDEPGALRRFVEEIVAKKLLIEEISVGTPRKGDGDVMKVPVQVYTVAAGTPTPTPTSTP